MIIIDIRRRWDPHFAQTSLILPGGREYNTMVFKLEMIIIDIRRRWDPPVAQTGSILPGGREYNIMVSWLEMIIIDIRRRWDPYVAQTSLLLPGGRECNIMVSKLVMIILFTLLVSTNNIPLTLSSFIYHNIYSSILGLWNVDPQNIIRSYILIYLNSFNGSPIFLYSPFGSRGSPV